MRTFVFCFIFTLITFFTANAVDPLPQAGATAVSNYEYRKASHVFYEPTDDIDTEVSTHCLFPGSSCRFTATPQNQE